MLRWMLYSDWLIILKVGYPSPIEYKSDFVFILIYVRSVMKHVITTCNNHFSHCIPDGISGQDGMKEKASSACFEPSAK